MCFPERLVTLAHSLGNVPRELAPCGQPLKWGPSVLWEARTPQMIPPPTGVDAPHLSGLWGGQKQKDGVRLLGSEPQFIVYTVWASK